VSAFMLPMDEIIFKYFTIQILSLGVDYIQYL